MVTFQAQCTLSVCLILILLQCSSVQAQDGEGTYAGYRVRQTCIGAGSTEQEGARIKASINFYLCCHDPKNGPGKLCCENCLEQWSEYFDWIYPCFKAQGGEKLQRRTEDAMDENFYKWDSTRYLWICAGPRRTILSATAILLSTLLAYALA